jgi:tripartite-type tricarboxylate transporter receptor subunit TctC
MNPKRILAMAIMLGAASFECAAQGYPSKPVHLVVASTAGGYIDRTARLVGDKLALRLGQPVLVENRGGAGGNIAAKGVVDAAPDGYTLLATSTQIAVNATLYKDPGFNVVRDLATIAVVGATPGILTVHPSNPANTLQELVRNATGGRLTHASGVGTSSHIAADYLFRVLAHLNAEHVPFKGGAQATTAVLGNQVDVLNGTLGSSIPYVKQGRLKALAVLAPKRAAALPDVPTAAESGYPGFQELSWIAFFAPARTPGAIVQRLNTEINQIIALPDVSKALVDLGMELSPESVAEGADFVRRELDSWTRIVRATGVTVD